jgi:hypothetical protein
MIHYHGLPITPATACAEVITARHAFISFIHDQQTDIAMEVAQSFAVDNGAFSAWKKGKPITDWTGFYDWVASLKNHPAFDFAVIPDVIDGDEVANDNLVAQWPFEKWEGAPVWHMHESIERFFNLCHEWPRVCIGSSGSFTKIGTPQWWGRITAALNEVVNDRGQSPCKLHGLRMLNPAIFSKIPFSSVDSTNIARNIGIDKAWNGSYMPPDKAWRAKVMASRIESVNGAQSWCPFVASERLTTERQHELFL